MPVTINGTTGIAGVDGSAGTPAVQGADTNTGVFFPAADTIAFATAGTEDMRILSNGNVGIATTSPQAKLHAVSTVTITDDSTYPIIAGDATTNGKRLLLGYTGASNGYGVIQAVSSGVAWTDLAVQPNGGNLLVGTTTPFAKFSMVGVGGNNQQTLYGGGWGSGVGAFASLSAVNTSNADVIYFNTSAANVGKIAITSTATSYVTSSDYRLKENVQPMTGALAKVALLKPCTYTWKFDGSAGEGFIAHELADVVPDAVTGEKDEVNEDGSIKPQGIDTSFLVATLTAALQELNAKVESLTAEIATLKGAQA